MGHEETFLLGDLLVGREETYLWEVLLEGREGTYLLVPLLVDLLEREISVVPWVVLVEKNL